MRLFTGISLPPEARAPLLEFVHRLRPFAQLAWTPEEKLHITTKFIGEWPESRLDELTQVLSTVTASGPIQIHIRGTGWMPNQRSPLALYAGVDPSDALTALARSTEQVLGSLGISRENRLFRPHVTLARLRRAGRGETGALKSELDRSSLDIPPFRASGFHLFLSANGSYTRLRDYTL